jgi:hypothetical protein
MQPNTTLERTGFDWNLFMLTCLGIAVVGLVFLVFGVRLHCANV